MMIDSKDQAVAITLINCLPVSEISVPMKKYSGEKYSSIDYDRHSDVEFAKNYLTKQELDALNKIVTAYLDIAEVLALSKEPMYMKDWLETQPQAGY